MFKLFIFVGVTVFMAWILIFEIGVPFVQGTPYFPSFRRRKTSELEEQIAEAAEDQQVEALQRKLASMKPASGETPNG